jgi:hypothetical protein
VVPHVQMIDDMSEFPTHTAGHRAGKRPPELSQVPKIFLLSPANVGGIRAGLVMNENRNSGMARHLRRDGVPLGELFSFMSGLYFRGKLAYARAFALAPTGLSGAFVITASGGLISPDVRVTLDKLREISAANLDPRDPGYRMPLDRDARTLSERVGLHYEVVLLGSVATSKYVDPLLEVFGGRLLFPAEFVGRGDMSRGGLMLRCVQTGVELTYVPVLNAKRNGRKPPKLEPMPRSVGVNSPSVKGQKIA